MSFEKAKAYLEKKGYASHIIIPGQKSGTVEEAAQALGVPASSIAKTMSFLIHDEVVLIVMEGTAHIDNHKYKSTFHVKAKMIPFDEVEDKTGHAPGGVCPFGINEGIKVYLDESLKKFDTVYPACGNDQSAVKLTLEELEEVSDFTRWVDVCKEQIFPGKYKKKGACTVTWYMSFCQRWMIVSVSLKQLGFNFADELQSHTAGIREVHFPSEYQIDKTYSFLDNEDLLIFLFRRK